MKPFVVLGDLIADLYLGIEQFPIQPGQHQSLSLLTLGPGGAGNVAVAAARLGLLCTALGSVGDDWIGQHIWSQLRGEGVDTKHIVQMQGESTSAAVVLRADSARHVFMGRGGTHGPESLPPEWGEVLRGAGVLFVDGWTYRQDHPAMIRAGLEEAGSAGASVLFDPGPFGAEIEHEWLRAVLARVHVLLVTESEAQALTGTMDARAGRRTLREWGARTIIVKLGARGCVIDTGGEVIECPGYPVQAVDSIAAGDCFSAAVGWGLLRQQAWDVIGGIANAVGAAKVQKIGTALAAPTRAEVLTLLQAQRPDLAAKFSLI